VDELTEFVKQRHTYDVPEVLALPVLGGNTDYLAWLTEETRPG
jgi:periplasmic divalent cation tolerance protein